MLKTLLVVAAVAVVWCHGEIPEVADPSNIPEPKLKSNRSIKIERDSFLLDGKQFRFVAGSLHYFRLPAQYWRDRMSKMRAAGLNALSTYVEWSFHEREERQYDWSGDRDLFNFLQLAAEEKLLVILKPGPYICAERDLGGLPYWLLSKYPDIQLRTNDKNFISEVETWMDVLFERIKPLLYGKGGPVILVQVENEYGSYSACDGAYMQTLRDVMQGHVGDAALLYTADGSRDPGMMRCGSVNGTLSTMTFGSATSPESAFRELRVFMPRGPLMNSEYYTGWMTHWGERMQGVRIEDVVINLRRILKMGASVNLYVFFGGTNFEYSAGANFGPMYAPDITSYDYDAPLTEYGSLTPKYDAIKELLQQYHPWAKELPAPPQVTTVAYGPVELLPRVALLSESGRSALGSGNKSVTGTTLPTFESLRQRAGLVLYETRVPAGGPRRLLRIDKPRDRVYVYVDGRLAGVLSRMHDILTLPLDVKLKGFKLSLLVESQGRINFGSSLKDFKGIISEVKLDNLTLSGKWTVLGYPLEELHIPETVTAESDVGTMWNGPVLFEGSFTLPKGKQPEDTFLDPSGWTKGYVWVNGYNLGRYWPRVGPQVTLYLPGVYLNPSPTPNVIRILELESAGNSTPHFLELGSATNSTPPPVELGSTGKSTWHSPELDSAGTSTPHSLELDSNGTSAPHPLKLDSNGTSAPHLPKLAPADKPTLRFLVHLVDKPKVINNPVIKLLTAYTSCANRVTTGHTMIFAATVMKMLLEKLWEAV